MREGPSAVETAPPLVSVIIPTCDRPERLRVAVESVLRQTYAELEAIVVNDGGSDLGALLASLDTTGRVVSLRLARNRERAAARNAALRLARGTYVAYLDDEDRYEPDHVETLVRALETSGGAVAYTDATPACELPEGEGYRVEAKEWSCPHPSVRDWLLVSNCIPLLCVMHRRDCLDEVGAFDETLETHEDWDLLIRLSRRWEFVHVEKTTCAFAGRHDGSSTGSRPRIDFAPSTLRIYERYVAEAASAGILARRAEVLREQAQSVPEQPFTCSIIVPVLDRLALTRQCLVELAQVSRGADYEVIIVDNGSTDGTPAFLATLGGDVRVIRNERNLGFATACNQGAAAAAGRYLVFLNNDTIPKEGWLRALVEEVERHPEVAVVGSKLLYPNGTVQHAGVAFSRTFFAPYHVYRNFPAWVPWVNKRRELQAVTAASMLVRREAFEAAGGFDVGYRNGFEDVDLCLTIRKQGGRIVYQPRSVLYHLESRTPGRNDHDHDNVIRLQRRWAGEWVEDEDTIYVADGHAFRPRWEAGRLRELLEPLHDPAERRRWERVAEVQGRALAAGFASVRPLLVASEWPEDAIVLRWGVLAATRAEAPKAAAEFRRRLEGLAGAADAELSASRLPLAAP